LRRLLKRLHQLIFNIYRRAELACFNLCALLLAETLHSAVTGAQIQSSSKLKNAIKKKNNPSKRYIYRSFPYGKSFSNGRKTIQSHLHLSVGFFYFRLTYFDFFNDSITRLLRTNKSRSKLVIDKPVFVLAYYNTHFGHCTGEILGTILFYSDLISEDASRKLLVPTLTQDTDSILSLFAKNKLLTINSELFLSHELILTNVVVLPLVHPHQNLNYLRQKLSTQYPYCVSLSPKRVFVTSLRPERIINITDVVAALREKNFYILAMVDFGVIENTTIKNADLLLIEDGSLGHLALMHRDKKYFVLSPARDFDYSPADFFGGYVFNEFHSYLRQEIPCEVVSTDKHIMSSRIVVDINSVLHMINESEF
jgi:hypothetical protein